LSCDNRRRMLPWSQQGSGRVAATDLPLASLAPRLNERLLLAYVHDARHERVHGAEIAEVALARERMLELVVGIQTLGRKTLVVARYRVRGFIVIGPGDLGARGDRDLLRGEGELRDLDRDR